MSIDSILSMQHTNVAVVANMVLLIIIVLGSILMSYLVDSFGKAITIAALLLVVCLGAGWAVSAHEEDRVSEAQEEVADGFDQKYGLKLDDRDLAAMKNIEKKDVTRNLETADGLLKQVLFRVVDDNVLPHTLDGAGTWIPMPAHQITR